MTISISCPWCEDLQPVDLHVADEFHCDGCGTTVQVVDPEPAYSLELAA